MQPGFTAESSTYHSTHAYVVQLLPAGNYLSSAGLVVPQQCGSFCGGDPDCMDTCIDWVTSGAPFRGGAGPRPTGEQCFDIIRSCYRRCGRLPRDRQSDCFDSCTC